MSRIPCSLRQEFPFVRALEIEIREDVLLACLRALLVPENGSKLRPLVGAVIYVRVSTKEQTENLSLPTQLRACEDYCRHEGYAILERFKEEAESAKGADRTELQG